MKGHELELVLMDKDSVKVRLILLEGSSFQSVTVAHKPVRKNKH